jgi:hypothetical protein
VPALPDLLRPAGGSEWLPAGDVGGHTDIVSIWSMLEECVSQLDEPFRKSEIVGWFRRHYPDVRRITPTWAIEPRCYDGSTTACTSGLPAQVRQPAASADQSLR